MTQRDLQVGDRVKYLEGHADDLEYLLGSVGEVVRLQPGSPFARGPYGKEVLVRWPGGFDTWTFARLLEVVDG